MYITKLGNKDWQQIQPENLRQQSCVLGFSPPRRPHSCPAESCPAALTTCEQLLPALPKNTTGSSLKVSREKQLEGFPRFLVPKCCCVLSLLSSLPHQRCCFLSHFLDGCLLCDSTTIALPIATPARLDLVGFGLTRGRYSLFRSILPGF